MFKSVFTKYMLTFALIVFVSFLVLALVISSIITRYAGETIMQDVRDTSYAASNILSFNYQMSDGVTFDEYVKTHDTAVRDIIGGLKTQEGDAENKNAIEEILTPKDNRKSRHIIMIFNKDGRLLSGAQYDKNDFSGASDAVPPDIIKAIRDNGLYSEDGNLGGFLKNHYMISACPVVDTIEEGQEAREEMVGFIVSCATTAREAALGRVMNRTVIMASLWVMLAAVIAVYFISDRVTAPLRTMTDAAKEFAEGKMDVRVHVQGRDEIAELGNAFNHMADSLAETEKMRNSFLANVSHDLRTPMTTIAGFVDGMLSGAIPPDKHSEYLEIVSSEVHRLSRLVTQILDISKMESGDRKFTFARFDICEMARLILISFEQKIEEKKLEVEFDTDADSMYAYGDKDAIHQVLYNLCDNARKFSKEGGVYRISIHATERDLITVSVYNQGQGIPAEELPYVFDRFYKTDKSRGLDKTGVGLGLYIAKTILDAHHQHIEVKSTEGEYCEFSFTLALDQTEKHDKHEKGDKNEKTEKQIRNDKEA